jgi:hypothetical protein
MAVSFSEEVGFQHPSDQSFQVGALTPYEALIAGGDKKKEILLRRSNANIDKILCDVIREMLQQKLASIHYDSVNTWLLFVPTMTITLLSAVISIFGTSQVISNEDEKIWFSITVACLQLALSVLYVHLQLRSQHPIRLPLDFHSFVRCMLTINRDSLSTHRSRVLILQTISLKTA